MHLFTVLPLISKRIYYYLHITANPNTPASFPYNFLYLVASPVYFNVAKATYFEFQFLQDNNYDTGLLPMYRYVCIETFTLNKKKLEKG